MTKQSNSLQITTEDYQILAASEPWSDLHRMNCTTWSDARSRETHYQATAEFSKHE